MDVSRDVMLERGYRLRIGIGDEGVSFQGEDRCLKEKRGLQINEVDIFPWIRLQRVHNKRSGSSKWSGRSI